jgi:TetR/AcrR family transcriptional repressor of lmrAB and yxaGH operons
MAHRTISEEEFLDRALDLFRTYGYEGVSLSRLSEATGLEKASLYYRYPGGKEEIVMAVAARVVQGFEEHLFPALKAEGSPRKRVTVVVEQLRDFYCDGSKPCAINMLSIAGGGEDLKTMLRNVTQAWLKAFTEVARESGMSLSLARLRAEEAIVRIEGSLVVARALGDNAPFQRTLKLLPDLLTEA